MGAALFEKHICFDCHGPDADGSGAFTEDGAIPDLRYLPAESHRLWNATVLGGSHQKKACPASAILPAIRSSVRKMSAQESDAIHAYVIDQSWKAYNAEQSKLK